MLTGINGLTAPSMLSCQCVAPAGTAGRSSRSAPLSRASTAGRLGMAGGVAGMTEPDAGSDRPDCPFQFPAVARSAPRHRHRRGEPGELGVGGRQRQGPGDGSYGQPPAGGADRRQWRELHRRGRAVHLQVRIAGRRHRHGRPRGPQADPGHARRGGGGGGGCCQADRVARAVGQPGEPIRGGADRDQRLWSFRPGSPASG